MRLEFKLFLVLVTIQIGCAGVPVLAHPNFPGKASPNAATESYGLRAGVPQFWQELGDPLLNRLIAEGISRPIWTLRSSLSDLEKPGPCIEAMNLALPP